MENPQIILTIVVPVYNVSQYLPKCLDSLLNQDIAKHDYEIIVINDGSTDNSGDIAQQYVNTHSNIILINQENQGLSGARNSGIIIARGKYIQFVDSDDFLEPNVEKALINKMEQDNLDILRFNYQNVNEQYQIFEPNKYSKPYVDYSDNVRNGISFLNDSLGTACYAWQFVVRTEIIKQIPLFKEGIYFEDTEWTPRIITSAKKITSTDSIIYNYLLRKGSITQAISPEKKKKVIVDSIGIIENMKSQMVGKSDTRWYEGMIAGTTISVLSKISQYSSQERKPYLDQLKNLNIYPLSNYHLNKGALRKRTIINFSPSLYCWLMNLKNN